MTVDVSALYTNINKEDGVEAVRKVLETRSNKSIPSDFLLKLLDCVFRYNIFEFDGELYQQLVGCAMGTKCAPNVADIFMSFIDMEIKKRAEKYGQLLFYRRFLDDILMIFSGSYANLHKFLADINTIHPSIKFTVTHTKSDDFDDDDDNNCSCPKSDHIPYLDTSLSIRNGRINSDLYRKPTDRCQYLLPQSCHPPHCPDNIPFSLALRIVRICTDMSERDMRLQELKDMLLARNYKNNLINAAIDKALKIPRAEAIKKVIRKQDPDRVVFSIMYDPRLPSISHILNKHYRTMVTTDPKLKEIFPKPPMVAYRRPPTIKDKLIHSKLPEQRNRRSLRQLKGMKKCLKCVNCSYVKEGKIVKAFASKVAVSINAVVTCETSNVVYCISCKKCKIQYIGKTEREIKERISEHRGSINNDHIDKSVSLHFNSRGHKLSDFSFTVLEKVFNTCPEYLRKREEHWIQQFNTKYKGLNKIS